MQEAIGIFSICGGPFSKKKHLVFAVLKFFVGMRYKQKAVFSGFWYFCKVLEKFNGREVNSAAINFNTKKRHIHGELFGI